MNGRDDWATRVSGVACPLCAPRPAANENWDFVAALSASSLYLAKNQTYRGQCQLIFDRRHAARFDQLTAAEYEAFAGDLFGAQNAVVRTLRPDHVNIESLGNVVPHLHWHIVPRYVGDARWGMPIWTTPLDTMADHRLDPADREALVAAIRDAL